MRGFRVGDTSGCHELGDSQSIGHVVRDARGIGRGGGGG